MMYKIILTSFLSFSVAAPCFAQKLKKDDKALVAGLEAHIHYLADDKLEGRRAGSTGEKLAMEYISAQFEKAGLAPLGDNHGWYQAFDINEGREISKSTYLFINAVEIKPADYFPLGGSPAGPGGGAPV